MAGAVLGIPFLKQPSRKLLIRDDAVISISSAEENLPIFITLKLKNRLPALRNLFLPIPVP
jgi:hypothetical protein